MDKLDSLRIGVNVIFSASPVAQDSDFVPVKFRKPIKQIALTTQNGDLIARIGAEDGKLVYEYHRDADKILGYKPWE